MNRLSAETWDKVAYASSIAGIAVILVELAGTLVGAWTYYWPMWMLIAWLLAVRNLSQTLARKERLRGGFRWR